MQKDERLAGIAAVFGCGETPALLLSDAMVEVRFAHKAAIGHQGMPLEHCWLVLDGTARVQLLGADGQRAQLAFHGPGELFGAFPEPTVHRADIVAHGDVRALRIGSRALAMLADDQPRIGAGLARLIARQLDMAMDRIAARTTLTAVGRVCAELVRLADDAHRITPSPVVGALALSANTTRETASRAIAGLQRRGVISRDDLGITILAPRLLADLIV